MATEKLLLGILKPGPAMVVSTALALGGVAYVGYRIRDVIEQAHASQPDAGALSEIRSDIRSIKDDMLKIKCQFHVEGMCTQPTVNVAGLPR